MLYVEIGVFVTEGGQTLQICDMLYVEIGVFVTVTSPCLLLTPSRQAVPAMPALLDCTQS